MIQRVINTPPQSRYGAAALLVVAAGLGLLLLVFDATLWDIASDHAYALIGFVSIDLGIAVTVLSRPRVGVVAALTWSIVQASVPLLNIALAPRFNLSHAEFAAYLFGFGRFTVPFRYPVLGRLLAHLGIAAFSWRALTGPRSLMPSLFPEHRLAVVSMTMAVALLVPSGLNVWNYLQQPGTPMHPLPAQMEPPPQQDVGLIQAFAYERTQYFPNPVLLENGVSTRLEVTTTAAEHVNRLRIAPFVERSRVLVVAEIAPIDFTPTEAGSFRIHNIGHGVEGGLIVAANCNAYRAEVRSRGAQSLALIHGLLEQRFFPAALVVEAGLPVQVFVTSLREQHRISIEGHLASRPVPARQVVPFEFTPQQVGLFRIRDDDPGHEAIAGQLYVVENVCYPLVRRVFEARWEGRVFSVAIDANATVVPASFAFEQPLRELRFQTLVTRGRTFVNVTVPKTLLAGPFRVLLDDVDVTGQLRALENQTHTALGLSYAVGAHTLRLVGTHVIPELPSGLGPALVLTLSILVYIVARKTGLGQAVRRGRVPA